MLHKKSEKLMIEAYQGERLAGNVNVSEFKKTGAVPPQDEVGGRGSWVWVICPHCQSLQHVWLDYAGEAFTCSNCGISGTVQI